MLIQFQSRPIARVRDEPFLDSRSTANPT